MTEDQTIKIIMLAVFFMFVLVIIRISKSDITNRHRETYRTHCLLYLDEYYPGATSESDSEIVRCANIPNGYVEVDIEILQDPPVLIEFTLKVNDFETSDMYVARIVDDNIEKFKLANLQ